MQLSRQDQMWLLRRFEPILKFTQGESFYPFDIDAYLRASSLWCERKGHEPVCLVPQGELNQEVLGRIEIEDREMVYYLKFIEPLDIFNLLVFIGAKQLKKVSSEGFRSGSGRLARVGLLSRLFDLIFMLSRLLRGRVPGDTSAAAMLEYSKLREQHPTFPYYARIIQEGSWVILQYWYFYAFNNWRSGFFGANDHEADWELVNIYGTLDARKRFTPEWVAYSAHEFSGKDLRRHWDALEGHRVGEHPVVYVAAGSHAGYFSPGEFVTEIKMPLSLPIRRLSLWLQNLWFRLLGRELRKPLPSQDGEALDYIAVPFVEYARGDGFSIGYGQEAQFSPPVLLDPVPEWISQYRGLWGLFAHDPVAGENGPPGPMYTREGGLRRAWHDPVGWVGLETCPPIKEARALMEEEKEQLILEGKALQREIAEKEAQLKVLGVINQVVEGTEVALEFQHQNGLRVAELSKEVSLLRERLVLNAQIRKVLEQRLADPDAQTVYQPKPGALQPDGTEMRREKFHPLRELWASLSIGVLLLGFVALALFYRHHLILGSIVLVSLLVFVESGFRGQFTKVIESMANLLAIFAALVLAYRFFWTILIFGVFLAGVLILWENLREYLRLTP